MERFYIILAVSLILSIKGINFSTQHGQYISYNSSGQDSLSWLKDFRDFRDAVYHNEKTRAKLFFDFPVLSANNEIWNLVYTNSDQFMTAIPDTVRPFTEADFEKYFNKLFSGQFIKCILKLKTEEFRKKTEIESPEFNDGSQAYKMIASIYKQENQLVLNLSSRFIPKDKNEDVTESSVIYIFKITQAGHLKFDQVRIAG